MTGLLNGGVYFFSVAGKLAHSESKHVGSQHGSIYLCKHYKHIIHANDNLHNRVCMLFTHHL